MGILITWLIAMAIGFGLGREGMKYEMQCKINLLEEKLRSK